MKLNGNTSQYAPVPLQGEDIDSNRTTKERKDGDFVAKENIENDFHMAPLAVPEESKEEVSEKILPMTPLRKLCFVLSLMQCALFIIAFGWLIPCKLPRYFQQQSSVLDWNANFPSYESVTVMDVSSYDATDVVIIGFASRAENETSGIKALHIKDGSVQWQLALPGAPFSLDCEHLDVNGDGIADCIVGLNDRSAHIGAFNKSDRHIFWFLHSHQNTLDPLSISRPVVGVDCDNDRTKEVIFPFTDSSGSYYLATMSGLTGQILGTVNLTICKKMPEILAAWNATDSLNIVFTCNDGQNGNVRSVPASDLCENTTGLAFDKLDSKFLARLDGDEIVTSKIVLKDDGGESLLTATNRGKVMLYDEFRQVWSQKLALNHTFRSVTSGNFVNSSDPDILIASGDPHVGSEIVVLNSENGSVKQKFQLENVTVTSFITVSKAFGDSDAILLKVIEPDGRSLTSNASTVEVRTAFVNVKFLLLECTETGTYKTILSTPSFTNCQDNVCRPDVYTQQDTASVVDVDGDKEYELVFFGKTYREPLGQTDEVRLVRLDNVVPLKSCTTCSCSS